MNNELASASAAGAHKARSVGWSDVTQRSACLSPAFAQLGTLLMQAEIPHWFCSCVDQRKVEGHHAICKGRTEASRERGFTHTQLRNLTRALLVSGKSHILLGGGRRVGPPVISQATGQISKIQTSFDSPVREL